MTIELDALAHSASRVILASPRNLFRAFVDPEMLASWRAPEGMTATLAAFDPRPGGGYRMVLRYPEPGLGKTSSDSDVVEVRFAELAAEERIVELVTFTSDDPAFDGEMRLTTSFAPVADGTKVIMVADHVPPGIEQADHEAGMASSLRKLALLTE
ncbi:SRPBCC domain-containing protein [Sphingomonas sp. MG17]|uniref:SRPBCC domain-containing protein n=1 Tax=Sphingomonas tagetis TaxID=2949092 RepID=A0A9X2HI54_9SPHN|nr:SRPBCC domain-containing protein [Sphingomonas tagetis]